MRRVFRLRWHFRAIAGGRGREGLAHRKIKAELEARGSGGQVAERVRRQRRGEAPEVRAGIQISAEAGRAVGGADWVGEAPAGGAGEVRISRRRLMWSWWLCRWRTCATRRW